MSKVDEKLKTLTGILRDARKSWRDAGKPLEITVPKFKKIKVNPMEGLGRIAGPRKAKEGLNHIVTALLSGVPVKDGFGYAADRCVEYVDFEQFAQIGGVRLELKCTARSEELAKQIGDWRTNLFYTVNATVTDPSKPLAVALKTHQEAREAQVQDLKTRREAAEAAVERAQLPALDELATVFAGGARGFHLPVLEPDESCPATRTLWAGHFS